MTDPATGSTVAVAPSAFSAERKRQIRTEQIRSLYQQFPSTTTGSMIAGAVMLLGFWNQRPKMVLLVWAAVLCLYHAVRVRSYFRYCKATPEEQADPRWGRGYTLALATIGCIWGSAGLIMFVPESLPHQALLAFLLYGIAMVSMTSLSAYAPAFYCFIPLTLLPFTVRMLLAGGDDHLFLALPGIIVLLMALALGREVNKLITESLNKRFENLELIVQLRQQMQAADAARGEAEVANRAKSRFLAAASHDLRQPLHALGLFAAALDHKIRYPEVRSIVDSINTSVAALETLFNELLDISKLDAGVIEPHPAHFEVQPLLARLRADFEPEARQHGLKLKVAPSRTLVYSDPILVERILRNLISNALRYTSSGGVVIGARRRGDKVRIEVRDTGVGIDAAERERIFEEFYQLGNPERHSKKGLGLGLAIVRRLATLLDCPLDLRSAPGRGSMFSIALPLGRHHRAQSTASEAAPAPAGDIAGRFIVVIDDEEAILDGMRVLLGQWRCDVVTASGTEEALAKIGETGRYPDLIVADYRLRENETGVDSIMRMRNEFGSEIPAILVTGSTTPDRTLEAERGRFHLLNKPVLPDKLRALISLELQRSPAPPIGI